MPFFDRFYLIYLGTSCQNLEEKYWVEDSGNVFEVVTGTEKTAHRPCRGLFYRVVFRKDLCFPSLVFPSSNTTAWFVVPLGAKKVLHGPSRLYEWIWSSRAGPQPKRCWKNWFRHSSRPNSCPATLLCRLGMGFWCFLVLDTTGTHNNRDEVMELCDFQKKTATFFRLPGLPCPTLTNPNLKFMVHLVFSDSRKRTFRATKNVKTGLCPEFYVDCNAVIHYQNCRP